MSDKTAGKFVGILFVGRTMAHILHLNTDSYSKHKALEEFYTEIVDLADSFAEQYQGKFDCILEIPILSASEVDPIKYIEDTRSYIEKHRYSVCSKDETSLQNVIDEIEGLCNSTLFKLRRLK